jgi:hypothetical protein
MSHWTPATSILHAHFATGAAITSEPCFPPLLYVVGGSGASGDVEVLIPASFSVEGEQPARGMAVPSMLTPRFGHAVSIGFDRRIYAIGGRSNPGATLLKGVEAFLPAGVGVPHGLWAPVAPMPTAREHAAAALEINGVIYVAGGSNGSAPGTSSPLKTLEGYQPSTDQWESLRNMHTARDGAAAVTGTDGRIYVIGGGGASGALSSVEAYDPAHDTWAPATPMNTPRVGLGAVLGGDGQIYAIGGENRNSAKVLSTVEVYNFATRTWTPGPTMSTGRFQFATALGHDGRIYAIGGNTALFGPTNSVEALYV